MSKLPKEVIEQIPLLYSKCFNKAEVARQLGISQGTVNKYLTLAEVAPPQEKVKKERKKITDEDIIKINQIYSEKKDLTATAKELGTTPSTVKKYLNEENLKINKQMYDDRDALWYYIIRLFGVNSEDKPVSDWNLVQMSRFKKNGMPYRGQLLTLKYFYEVEKHSIKKSNNSIGIIAYKWSEAARYYQQAAIQQEEIGKQIQEQLERDRIEIKYKPSYKIGTKNKRKKEINLDEV